MQSANRDTINVNKSVIKKYFTWLIKRWYSDINSGVKIYKIHEETKILQKGAPKTAVVHANPVNFIHPEMCTLPQKFAPTHCNKHFDINMIDAYDYFFVDNNM